MMSKSWAHQFLKKYSNSAVIEVAFTVGSSADSNFLGGSNLEATIAQQVEASNNAFRDVGLDIEIQNVGIYKLGEDGNLNALQRFKRPVIEQEFLQG